MQRWITIVYTADKIAGIFLPHELDALNRGDVVERVGAVTTRYIDATAVAMKAGL